MYLTGSRDETVCQATSLPLDELWKATQSQCSLVCNLRFRSYQDWICRLWAGSGAPSAEIQPRHYTYSFIMGYPSQSPHALALPLHNETEHHIGPSRHHCPRVGTARLVNSSSSEARRENRGCGFGEYNMQSYRDKIA